MPPLAAAETQPAGHVGSTPSLRVRITVFVHGVLLPSILLAMSLSGFNAAIELPWQSGQWPVYVTLLLSPKAWLIFAPGFLFAMISISTWAIMPETARLVWLRLGIYTGGLLAVHYCALLLTMYHAASLIAAAIVWPAWYGILWLLRRLLGAQFRFTIFHMMVLTSVVAVAALLAQVLFSVMSSIFITALMAVLLAAPLLNAAAYLYGARQVARYAAGTRGQPLRWMWAGIVSGVLMWVVGLRYATLVMLEEYAKLPTTNPNCYFANAAARAPSWLTGARQPGEITGCVRRMKFLEIVLRAASPRLHGLVRQAYDRWGSPLAVYCQQHTSLATLSCLLLKPLELIAWLMRISLRIDRTAIEEIYQASSDSSSSNPSPNPSPKVTSHGQAS